MTDVFDCKASPAKERMTSDWEAGEKHVDYIREKDPVERSEAKTVVNVFDCEARQAKEREGK